MHLRCTPTKTMEETIKRLEAEKVAIEAANASLKVTAEAAMFCFVLFCLSYNSRSCLSGRPLPLRDRSRCGASGLRLKKLVAALPLRPSRTANADGL